MSTNESTEQAMISREEYTAFKEDIEGRIAELEQWVQEWKEVIHALADCNAKAKSRNARLALREVIDPCAETTTVEQLLHMLESECPVVTVLDALKSKELTEEESRRLAGNLETIAEEATKALAALREQS